VNTGDEVDPHSLMPRRYADATPEDFAALARATASQQADDEAFALANNAVVTEGPWEGAPPQMVAYIGIDEFGQRMRLVAVAEAWRYSPFMGTYRPGGADGELTIRPAQQPDMLVVKRILLGPQIAGMVVGRAQGAAPVQSRGVIDGEDYYFRARGDAWSFSVGGGDLIQSPTWYYEEAYGTWPDAGRMPREEAYQFIEKAAALYRAGTPTMVRPSLTLPKVDRR